MFSYFQFTCIVIQFFYIFIFSGDKCEEKNHKLCEHLTLLTRCDSPKVKELCPDHCTILLSGKILLFCRGETDNVRLIEFFELLTGSYTHAFTGDNLVVIAGSGYNRLSDVELVSTQTNNDLCNPLDLPYIVRDHASVGTDLGILTCGGIITSVSFTSSVRTSKCVLQTKEGQTTTFPLMKRTRANFGLGIVNDMVYAVGGYQGGETTMEKINFKTDSEWTLTNLPFSVYHHCLATTTKSLVITGGYDNGVSKVILRL